MLRIFRNDEKKTTTAIIEDCEYDAINTITKRLYGKRIVDEHRYEPISLEKYVPSIDEALMSPKYCGTVACDERDEYNEKVGESQAVKKAMANHNDSYNRALLRWQVAILRKIREVSPDTFAAALRRM